MINTDLKRPSNSSIVVAHDAHDLCNFILEACNIIRGSVSQDNFKDYITPLLCFKRISEIYDKDIASAEGTRIVRSN